MDLTKLDYGAYVRHIKMHDKYHFKNKLKIYGEDILYVVDMQYDFVPKTEWGPDGNFAVAEGDKAVPFIVKLIDKFNKANNLIIASRDYHPRDHVSFMPDGPFPAHCVEGSKGSKFLPPIRDALKKSIKDNENTFIVFKGFHQSIDSFGGFTYRKKYLSSKRVSSCTGNGCESGSLTGSFYLNRSNWENPNSPPDIMTDKIPVNSLIKFLEENNSVKCNEILTKKDMVGLSRKNATSKLILCGLALDYCVIDTAINASHLGYKTYIVLDACRPAFVPPLGGYLHTPDQLIDLIKINASTKNPVKFVLSSQLEF